MSEINEEKKIIFSQPYETKVKVLQKTTAKGDFTPEVEVEIIRKLEKSEKIVNVIEIDVYTAVKKAKEAFNNLKELQ